VTEYYPGSKTPVRNYGNPADAEAVKPYDPAEPLELGTGRTLLVKGEPVEFFTIGVLARALNRKPVTVRKWENEGTLPKAGYRDPRVRGKGKQRLYSRPQIEVAVRIAYDEGILTDIHKQVSKTKFTERVYKAWRGEE
jgi:hypothetical protein